MDINDILIKRIRAANFGRRAVINILYAEIGESGGNVAFCYTSKHETHVTQVHLPKSTMKSLIQGKNNPNLDAALRY